MKDLRDFNFGIEIETVWLSRDDVAKAIQTVTGGSVSHPGGPYDEWNVTDTQGRKWKAVSDSSLNAPHFKRVEVVSPVLKYGDMELLQQIVRAIRNAGAKINASCGIHIHIDAAPFNGRTLSNLARLVFKQEPLINHALGISPQRLRTYTKPISEDFIKKLEELKPQTKEELNRIWYGHRNNNPAHYDDSRYHGVNLHNVWYRGTCEFRWFESTLHAGKIKSYIQFCLAVAAKAMNNRAVSSKKRSFNEKSAKYDFRVFLLRLGLIGDEFKTARKHLMANMPGDAAFKNGRPQDEAVA